MEPHVLDRALGTARELQAFVEKWMADNPKTRPDASTTFTAGGFLFNALVQAAIDIERLVAEVKRLIVIHQDAGDIVSAAMDVAYHTQARLIREGGRPFVPNVSEKEAQERWSRIQNRLKDAVIPYGAIADERQTRIDKLMREKGSLDAQLIRVNSECATLKKNVEHQAARADEVQQIANELRQKLVDEEQDNWRLRRKANRLRKRLGDRVIVDKFLDVLVSNIASRMQGPGRP
jgi:predicted RNase H-like nuclease (RuvC/YqgF family)